MSETDPLSPARPANRVSREFISPLKSLYSGRKPAWHHRQPCFPFQKASVTHAGWGRGPSQLEGYKVQEVKRQNAHGTNNGVPGL